VTYSSKTIGTGINSRNQEHDRAFAQIKAYLGARPLVLDREFSYLSLLENMQAEKINFVIRLNRGKQGPKFADETGQEIKLNVGLGKQVICRNVYYKGKVRLHVIGVWQRGFSRPLWVMSNLDPEVALRIYFHRMKIEESFKDLKDLLGVTKVINKHQEYMEQMVALVLLAFSMAFLIGEAVRDRICVPPPIGQQEPGKRWQLYSGLFILLRQKIL
jgi:transposase